MRTIKVFQQTLPIPCHLDAYKPYTNYMQTRLKHRIGIEVKGDQHKLVPVRQLWLLPGLNWRRIEQP